jgi:hypothetical protein
MESNVLDLLPIRRGHFRFESGYHGEIWLDLDRLFANPRRIAPLARELAGRLSGHDVEAVVGPLVGGAFLAQMIAAELEAEFAYAEPQPAAAGGRLKAAFPLQARNSLHRPKWPSRCAVPAARSLPRAVSSVSDRVRFHLVGDIVGLTNCQCHNCQRWVRRPAARELPAV